MSLSPDGEDRSYDVLIGAGILDELGDGGIPLPHTASLFVVTDSNVARLYGKKLLTELSQPDRRIEIVSFPAGEASKSIQTASMLASRLSELGADRESALLALGGGVVGDLTGFVASIYKRGIDYIQLPTTLLAQVDSSIGGKTGVDTPWGKNQLGTFYQPRGVLADPLTLRTLPPPEMLNGVAEIVKYSVVADRRMFYRLSRMDEFGSEIMSGFIESACRIKAEIVSRDERETNLRAVLNYGHTVGHAIESASNYSVSHGTCVILGMMAEGWIALRLGILQETDFEKQSTLLRRLSEVYNLRLPDLSKKDLLRFAVADKKATLSSIRMSLPEELGKMHTTSDGSYKIPVTNEIFEESIDYLREAFSLS